MTKCSTLIIASLLSFNTAHAAEMSATINTTGANQHALGSVVFTETPFGLLIKPNLTGLTPGLHGFHLHQHPDCGADGMNSGGHYDPANTNSHQGPYGNGHLGDLPVLYVSEEGIANTPTLAPRLKLNDLKGLTTMIHADGDNYTDTPPLGGGGARIACGVIK
ncbi:superoxide dismutase family protein [Legionella bononiensis]|uniref:Superoxide dismutase [Cu-Zn] n=1 Tax=Legionella bononiensis TaxID=2793102 RepID=A0ABS1WAX8_9GAMM|nr:superoxide dismutase family protein [Legionella bononiensis]MBL7480265.1 superoxide dismutase family protein [Legionella bononiensis]MBL7526503.1 superoxide dismutase family protein [Legionella bononiensis]MBL7563003.1 superoxide dismutase family protein [Legionella bononiensis]